MDKQTDMLRLIIQKMEIEGEVCDSDDSDTEDTWEMKPRSTISDVITRSLIKLRPVLPKQSTSTGSNE